MFGKCVGNTLQVCSATCKHDTIGELTIVAGTLDLFNHQIGNIAHASLDRRC